MGCVKETDSSDCQATQPATPAGAQANQDTTADPVNVVTGAFTLSDYDVSIPSRRLVLALTRHYNSQLHDPRADPGPFGRGWTHSLALRLHRHETQDLSYVDDSGNTVVFARDPDTGGFTSPPGALGLRLTSTPTGGFRLRQIDGLTAEFNGTGYLMALCRPGPRADSCITLTYDDQGRLAAAAAPGGCVIKFAYEGDNAQIVAVTDHTDRCWRYEYDAEGDLERVLDPAGRVRRYEYATWQGTVSAGLNAWSVLGGAESSKTVPRVIRAMRRVYAYAFAGSEPGRAEVTNQYTSDGRVYQQIDGLGNVTRFDYNRFSRVTQVTDPAGWTTVYGFDASGNTTKVRRPGGGTWEYVYDDRRNLVAEIDPLGNCTEYVEFVDPKLAERQAEFGRRAIANRADYLTPSAADVRVGYDRFGNRPLRRDALGNTTRFHDYTEFGRPQRVELPDGGVIAVSYDERSGLPLRAERRLAVGRTQPLRWIQDREYDEWGNVIQEVEWSVPEGGEPRSGASPHRTVAIDYDTDGIHPVCRREWSALNVGSGVLAAEERWEWNATGHLIAHTVVRRQAVDEPHVLRTEFGLDSLDRVVRRRDAEGNTTCWLLDAAGRVCETFVVLGELPRGLDDPATVPLEERRERRLWSYDAAGNQLIYTDPSGAKTSRIWDERGLCTEITDAAGNVERFEYDRDGNQVLHSTQTGLVIRKTYDAAGRITGQSDTLGLGRSWTYDALGRLVAISEPAGATEYGHDCYDRLVRISLADGASEDIQYDERGKITRRARVFAGEELAVEAYSYDGLGRISEVYAGSPSAPDLLFALHYDDATRGVYVTDAIGHISRKWFDSTGKLIRALDADGREVLFAYDGSGRLIRRWSLDGSVDSQYGYDEAGRLLTAAEGAVVFTWERDSAGRPTRHDQNANGRRESVSYRYDRAGRLVEKRSGEEWWMRYRYAAGSSLVSEIAIPGTTVDLVTDSAGRLLRENWPDAGSTTYEYGADGLLSALKSTDQTGTVLFSQEVVRDGRGRPVEELRVHAGKQSSLRYEYDGLNRLTCIEAADAHSAETRRFQYDAHGNRLHEFRNGLLRASMRYSRNNRLEEATSSDGQHIEYSYDRSGNLVRRGPLCIEYDSAQRVRQIAVQGRPTVRHQLSATDQVVLCQSEGDPEHVIYDHFQEIRRATPATQRNAYWGFQLDTLLALQSGGEHTRAITDSIGSVVGLLSPDSWSSVEYEPFGKPEVRVGALPPFAFCGKPYNPEAALYDARTRLYDPVCGRFVQPDRLGTADGLNLYQYASNNPLTYVDALGFQSAKSAQGQIAQLLAPGHLVERHVGKTDQELRDRLEREPNLTAASTFKDLRTAMQVVEAVVTSNEPQIDRWLDKGSGRMSIAYYGSSVLGSVLERGNQEPEPSSTAVITLQRDESMPTGFHVLTGYLV